MPVPYLSYVRLIEALQEYRPTVFHGLLLLYFAGRHAEVDSYLETVMPKKWLDQLPDSHEYSDAETQKTLSHAIHWLETHASEK